MYMFPLSYKHRYNGVYFISEKVLIASLSLNGGNVLDNLIDTIFDWNIELGLLSNNIDSKEMRDNIWNKLMELGDKFCKPDSEEIIIKPLIFAERHNTTTFGSILNISRSNCSIGEIFASVCKGIVRNLKDMMTTKLLKKMNCQRIVASGSAIIRNKVLKKQLELEFPGMPIVYKANGDAAIGAVQMLKKLIE